jgi:hypothetical protein
MRFAGSFVMGSNERAKASFLVFCSTGILGLLPLLVCLPTVSLVAEYKAAAALGASVECFLTCAGCDTRGVSKRLENKNEENRRGGERRSA